MSHPQVELVELAGNLALARVAGRSFPGLLVQGDSIKIVSDIVRDLSNAVSSLGSEEVQDTISELKETITFWVDEYERMMTAAQLPLPY